MIFMSLYNLECVSVHTVKLTYGYYFHLFASLTNTAFKF